MAEACTDLVTATLAGGRAGATGSPEAVPGGTQHTIHIQDGEDALSSGPCDVNGGKNWVVS